ncbi:MAG TPA: PAS domain-containing protein [Flavisolibacter sp.]|jgi:PAS domain S-box-containing protein|nr:PAS domain-containing protein [Flavisolibacter sp.]
MDQATTYHGLSFYTSLLDVLLNQFSHAVILLNQHATIQYASDNIESIAGFHPSELTGASLYHFLHPDDVPAARQQFDQIIGQHRNSSASFVQIRDKQGQPIWINAVAQNLMGLPELHTVVILIRKGEDLAAEDMKLAQDVAFAREQEREYLATELHDNINQMITATKLLVDTAILQPNKEELLKLSSEHLQAVSNEIRSLAHSMVQPDQHHLELHSAVTNLLHILHTTGQIQVQTNFEEAALQVLTATQQFQVFRIIQEGINNIIRHAKATQAALSLQRKADLIYLTISDNGTGFALSAIKPGSGITHITYRTQLLNGHFHIRAPEGEGTNLEIHFPI